MIMEILDPRTLGSLASRTSGLCISWPPGPRIHGILDSWSLDFWASACPFCPWTHGLPGHCVSRSLDTLAAAHPGHCTTGPLLNCQASEARSPETTCSSWALRTAAGHSRRTPSGRRTSTSRRNRRYFTRRSRGWPSRGSAARGSGRRALCRATSRRWWRSISAASTTRLSPVEPMVLVPTVTVAPFSICAYVVWSTSTPFHEHTWVI